MAVFRGALETGGVLEEWGAYWFSLPSKMALHCLRVKQWQVLLDFSSSQRSWQQPSFNNKDLQVIPKSQAPAGLKLHFSMRATFWGGGLKSSH